MIIKIFVTLLTLDLVRSKIMSYKVVEIKHIIIFNLIVSLIIYLYIYVRYIRKYKEAVEENKLLNGVESVFTELLYNTSDCFWKVDKEGVFVVISDYFEESLGFKYGDFLGKSIYDIVDERCVESLNRVINNGFISKRSINDLEIIIKDTLGNEHYYEMNGIYLKDSDHIIGTFKDITDSKKALEKVEEKSFIDVVTGLYNKNYYNDVIPKIDIYDNLPISIISGDVNGLKLANDIFGHDHGDELLKIIGNILKESCRDSDLVFRWGGDEFTIVLKNTSESNAKVVMDRVYNKCKEYEGSIIKPSISLGLATKYEITQSINEIEKEADSNMYEFKRKNSDKVKKEMIDWMSDKIVIDGVISIGYIDLMQYYLDEIGEFVGMSYSDINRLKQLAKIEKVGALIDGENYLEKTIKILKTSQVYYELIPLLEELKDRGENSSMLIRVYDVVKFFVEEYDNDKEIMINKLNEQKKYSLDVTICDKVIEYLEN